MIVSLTPPQDLADLAAYSAQIGADPLLIQGAGGNTSVKDGDVMWVKASGTNLADALDKDIFVPVDLPAMRASLADGSPDADKPMQFLLGDSTLRPSIETSLHAAFPHRVVIHVHCVNTLSHAVRADAEAILAEKLDGFDWRLAPYAKPGANLARAVRDRLGEPPADVAVLRNHGLIIAADTVAAAPDLLARVTAALAAPETRPFTPVLDSLFPLANGQWRVPEPKDALHQLASPARAEQAAAGSLYPDHVIFCGVAAHCVDGDRLPDASEAPPFVILPGRGVMVRTDMSPGALAMSRCLADVLVRVPEGAELTYLTESENLELLDWDAEKYRQRLNV
ncbi:MAG: class II aldolase/adducin family protein [Alphaproteobacteria bacterium]|nr:class II aldolase/adducin family protein [Alphaproteobacteria bacterium]